MTLLARAYSMNFDNEMEKILINDSKNVINQLNDKNISKRYNLLIDNAFAVSGINDKEIRFYYNKIISIYESIIDNVNFLNDFTKLDSLQKEINFIFKPEKHSPELSNVITNYYGNCIGLTTIYSIFALKIGLDLELVTSEKGFHFFNKVITQNKEYYVDCISKNPIEKNIPISYYEGDFEITQEKLAFEEINDAKLSDLIGAIYRSRAYKEKNLNNKIELYKKSLIINPEDKLTKYFLLNIK